MVMPNDNRPNSDASQPHGNGDESLLDAGLRAAFGLAAHDAVTQRAGSDSSGATGVLLELEKRFGVHSKVLLREDPDDSSAVTVLRGEASASGKYQVLGEIARGGVGVVLKGRDIDLGRDVAMKELQSSHAGNPAMVRRFVEEAQIAGQLQHPGVLPVYELGLQADRRPFFTMKLVKGRTLAALLEERANSASERGRFLRDFESVCQTIAYTHTRGVIHRDLKPSNIMVGPFGEVQVVDWGLAKVLGQGGIASEAAGARKDETVVQTLRSESPGTQSMAGSVMGTPAYMSPEQARGDIDAVDERSDVFALGGMLCEILTGKPPFEGTAREMMVEAAAARLDKALSRLHACDADGDLISLAKACLSADRKQRPRNGKAVAEAITAHLVSVEDRARAAELEATVAKTREAAQRRAKRLTIALASVAVLALLAIGAGGTYVQLDRAERAVAASQRVNDALNEAGVLLGQAQKAPIGETAPWTALRAACDRLAGTLADENDIDPAVRERSGAFLARLKNAERERRLLESVEDAIIIGATNLDRASWVRMAEQLRAALLEFGVDVRQPPPPDIAGRISASESPVQLVEASEMWIGSEGQLGYFGVQNFTADHLNQWVAVLHAADTNEFRSGQRRVYYAIMNEYMTGGRQDPAAHDAHLAALDELSAGIDMITATPRSLSWLATTYYLLGESDRGADIYRRAVIVHPTDFMFMFDFVFSLEQQGQWEECIRYLMACVALRPNVGGVWRKLGVAFREVNLLQSSLDSLQQSLVVQPDYPPTLVDLALTLQKMNRHDEALAAVDRALKSDAELASAHGTRGRLLHDAGDCQAALEEYRRAKATKAQDPAWKAPLQEWIDECERQLNGQLPASQPASQPT